MLEGIISKIISENKPRGIIAIDGYDASGKTFFAKKLSLKMTENGVENRLISIDDFHFPKEKRYEKGADSAVGFYEDSYDYDEFIAKTLIPFKENSAEICTKIFDLKTETPLYLSVKIPENCWLIVEGIFLQRAEIRRFWDLKIYLKISEEESLSRNLKREFGEEVPAGMRERFLKRYIGGQRLYHKAFQPESSADFVVDNSDFNEPKILKINV